MTRETLGDEDDDDERTLLTIPSGWPPQAPPAEKTFSGASPTAHWAEPSATPTPTPTSTGMTPPNAQVKRPRPTSVPQAPTVGNGGADLWGVGQGQGTKPTATARPGRIQPPQMQTEAIPPTDPDLEAQLHSRHWDEIVDRALAKILPPIVERLVQERLDKLMRDQEHQVDAKL